MPIFGRNRNLIGSAWLLPTISLRIPLNQELNVLVNVLHDDTLQTYFVLCQIIWVGPKSFRFVSSFSASLERFGDILPASKNFSLT